ncbi:Hsp20/alpha crystallin family protein [Geopsychrobacter electrodiphilus]|uniref:Hsp20/alpha crystallin family protein n=1 Tax=Geopsychrobacter electrodiphilus TaxID=225196 RepID=UPI00039EC7D0|nr:Hsp20/alpha crystallin family protein [Geopsychrobacter electrodiphilus]
MMNWNLFREMDNLRREMDTIFGGLPLENEEHSAFLPGIGTRRFPRLNLSEDANSFYLAALIPGVDAKSLDISLTGSTLSISGERLVEKLEGAHWQRQERGHGKFVRTLELPLDVDNDKIGAEYVDGVLRVILPKAESAKPKRISIKAGN